MSQNTPHFPTRTSLLSFVSFILSTRPQGGAKAQRTEEIQYMVYEYGKLKDSRDDLTSKKRVKEHLYKLQSGGFIQQTETHHEMPHFIE